MAIFNHYLYKTLLYYTVPYYIAVLSTVVWLLNENETKEKAHYVQLQQWINNQKIYNIVGCKFKIYNIFGC